MLNEQIHKLNQDLLDNPELYDKEVWRETRINPKEIVYTCRDPRCKAEPTEGDRHLPDCKIAAEILNRHGDVELSESVCPECDGSNLTQEGTKCFDCDASDYE